ncbi:type II toxin-antitoxin system TacA family antitoxin [Fundidesulfovibrio putealis]|uniref:type II toxin-antitoxin system TacA family antitoxin n=1 Tax=Fundidesulfovibrio putealis TaxID=270496 RepID=UPI000A077BE3
MDHAPSTKETALKNCKAVSTEQLRLVLSDEQWLLFTQALDRPPSPKPHLEALLQTKSVFD